VIKEKVKIGNRVTLGLGAVVLKDVEDDLTVVGVPAKPLRMKETL
jgi:serine acetyltransferase